MTHRVYYTAQSLDRQPIRGHMIVDASSKYDASAQVESALAEVNARNVATFPVRWDV